MIPTLRLDRIEERAPDMLELMRRATREVGVFYVDARESLPDTFFSDLFEQTGRLFRLPMAEKEALDLSSSPNYRGYVGLGAEFTYGVADLKESFEFAKEVPAPESEDPPPYYRFYGDNRWPDRLPGFRPAITAYSEAIDRIALAVLQALALTLDQPIAGEGLFQDQLCAFSRLIYYSDPSEFSAASARLDAHTDHALITIILQDLPGLEVRGDGGRWLQAVPPEHGFVVFPGELMEFWTRGYYRARAHRVHNRAISGERISIASFFLPDLRSTLLPIPASSRRLAGAELTISSDNPWLTSRGPDGEGDVLRPIVVGEKEWERMNAIFPDEAVRGGERA